MFSPAPAEGRRYAVPVMEYLGTEGKAFEGGKWLRYKTEKDLLWEEEAWGNWTEV